MKIKLTLILLLVCKLTYAQPIKPADYQLKAFKIIDKQLGTISFYIDTVNIKKRAPLFIDVNGSGGFPLCLWIKGSHFSSVMNSFNTDNVKKTCKKYHYIILDKPGTPFCDTIKTNKDVKTYQPDLLTANYKVSKEYNQRLSLYWRVNATKAVITYLINHHYWDNSKIVAFGYSEGGQVVPALAEADRGGTHVVPVVGSGLNQLYNEILNYRIKANERKITQQEAQDSIDIYLRQMKDIYNHPNDTRKQFSGHSYKRWASFGTSLPFENLRKLKIPIYMIVATADNNSPVFGLDYVPLDFLRLHKTNLTYEACVGCDHGLNSKDANGKQVSHAEYFDKVLKWVDKH